MGEYGIGQPVRREEDPYLLRGQGRYVGDVAVAGELRAVVLRSPHAHADILAIDVEAARAMPGVVLVLTGRDPAAAALGTQVPHTRRSRRDGSPAFVTPQPMLATDRVRHVGEAVAFVVAETLNQAKDAAEAIAVDYAPLPAVPSLAAAIAPDAPAVHDGCPGNDAFCHALGDAEATERGIAGAARVVRRRLTISRVLANPMEPRGCLAEHDPRGGRLTLRCTTQAPHTLRRILAGEILHIPEARLRVISENVGGGFGARGQIAPEYALACLAAKLTGRPVRWSADRSETFLSDEHHRDNITDAEIALDADGRVLALRVKTFANLGAYYGADRTAGPPINNLGVLAGTYVIPAIRVEVTGVLSNTMTTGPYRGAGRPEAAYVIETMMDAAARELGLDPVALRRRNTIPAEAMPHRTALVYTYDCGDFGKNIEDALALADIDGFTRRLEESRARGQLRGIGVSSTVEASNAGLIEHADIRFDPGGSVTVSVGTHDHGQGHQTTFRQIVADRLGLPPDQIELRFGDTAEVDIGTGTFGSRSTVTAGSAIVAAADKIIAKAKRIAAALLEADPADLDFAAGRFTVAGTDRSVALSDVARASFSPARLPPGVEPGLFEQHTSDGGVRTYPNGCHVSEVEIDRETGVVRLVRHVAVDDVGRMINPLLVEGQIHGGIAQGAGQALMEAIVYDAEGQLVTGSFTDSCMPRAGDLPPFVLGENEVPTATNPLGVKGAGESGTVGALSSITSAVADALARVGAAPVTMPATPEKVWRAMRDAAS
ncbi:xanthine dehydrogenase family protein molybdopterin-binding subunit [Rhodoplanes sp. TEM]|uniref:Xanthine dehydrogenase family protein molybdopterin-binding subunit n=1 Tax=Rhodoplanes tepidamans TaxID=200616 RepID=A0ABT5JHA1_RHOTP|nr:MULTISPECIES: xanthine dehydrogenase family protein molybdopterin-binding subunit [Rhodoplanes]MDC7788966.1 xanthine dehydrogenase family protein molybdopterin-binding subunit [Rhodoplanes tepidamans]MDC7987223.1 xanthine dehydrogenase family protein molybdopterin-binding subunit [Rhodoplanes sp. TEM]MDQ0358660.1 carbon-monoxide dehydrogenase large subunit [Rhodoplanes tepidamans]